MAEQPFERGFEGNPLTYVREGMDVYDRDGDKIGTVERIYFGSSPEEPGDTGRGAATADAPLRDTTSIIADVASAIFGTDQIPDVLQKRLLHDGFICVDSNRLFDSDRYFLPGQIAQVAGDRVTLNATRGEGITS